MAADTPRRQATVSSVQATARALRDLNSILGPKKVLSGGSLAEWLRNTRGLSKAFSHLAFGVIEWRKSIGRPTTATLAAGFVLEAWHWQEVLEYTPQGAAFVKLRAPHPVFWWDGKDDAEYWRVNYLVNGVDGDREHFVEARLEPDVRWTPRNRFTFDAGVRHVEPGVQGFRLGGGMFLPRFEVVARPVRVLGP